MRSQQTSIECRSVTKRFGTATVVDDLSFEVSAGTITGFAGANGAGKTTTMRMVLGLVAPTSGQALIDGRPYRSLPHPRRTVGAVLDGPGSHPAHTARDHLSVIAIAAGLPLDRVDVVLELVELGPYAGHRTGAFSMGMRQRLAMAAALLGDPPILILDEPVNGLDPPGMAWMRDLLRSLAAEGRALLVSSHLLGELAEVIDRAVIVDRGRLVADASLDQLLAGRDLEVELRCADLDRAAAALRAQGVEVSSAEGMLLVTGLTPEQVGDAVATAGAGPVHGLSERTSSLEDVYFELAGTLARPASTAGGPR